MTKKSCAVLAISVLGASLAFATATITFDPGPAAASNYTNGYAAYGMDFSTTNGFYHVNSGGLNTPDSGSAYLHFAATMEPLTITNAASTLFDLISVDISEYSVFANPLTVPVTGYKPGGSTVFTIFSLDGIIDGTGPNSDFETFFFGTDFEGLTHAEVGQVLYGMDNLVVGGIIPEPKTITQLGLGAVFLYVLILRRRRSANQ